MDRLLTVAEAAEQAGVSASLIYGWCGAGVLAHMRLGLPGRRGAIRIAEADLLAFLAGQKRGGRREHLPPAPKPKPSRLKHLHLPS